MNHRRRHVGSQVPAKASCASHGRTGASAGMAGSRALPHCARLHMRERRRRTLLIKPPLALWVVPELHTTRVGGRA